MVGALALALTFPMFLVLGAVERWGPCHGARPPFRAQLHGIGLQLVSIMAGCAALAAIQPWLPHPRPLWAALSLPAALLLSDGLQYWEHRIEHWWFWRVHAVHHSGRQLSCTSNVTHFGHQILMTLVYGLPISVVCGDPMGLLPVLVGVYWWAAFIHSPAKIDIGPLRWILVDNRMHRIHHSLDERHFDRNFGSILSIWDHLFGTMYWPEKDEWPATGVRDYGEITHVSEFLVKPFAPKVVPWRLRV